VSSNLWRAEYRPLIVEAYLISPVACVFGEPFLPLDGILEAASFHLGWPAVLKPVLRDQRVYYLPRTDHTDYANYLIPVKRFGHKDDPDWFWHASWAACPDGFALDRSHWAKRFDGTDPDLSGHLDFQGRSGRVNISSGRYKHYRMPLCLIVAKRLRWHCLGAFDGVAKLLREITHLGHKRSQGYGEVLCWEVLRDSDDYSLWTHEGFPARALPASYFEEARLPECFPRALTALRPPHWHPSRLRECVIPETPSPSL
jgi:CRISPR type IV-associated protein Csf3